MKCKGWLVLLVMSFCVGVFAADMVPTNFKATYLPMEDLEAKLSAQGLTVLGKHAVNGDVKHTSVIFTSDTLKKLGAEKGRGFISVLRVLHNEESRELIVSNPEYFIRAFYQKDYKAGMEAPVMKALETALGTLIPTEDGLPVKKLAKYNFMVGMPKYDDFKRVAKGGTADLSAKLESNAKGRIAFKLDIKGDGSSMLYGVGLSDGIEAFNDTLGTMGKSHLLPYMVLIEEGQANILHAKYYLALSFPQLTMTEFMKIMSVPGDIVDSFKADFK